MNDGKKIHSAIAQFKAYYCTKLIDALADINDEMIEFYADAVNQTMSHTRGILYAFGNGGNYAIARQFEMVLREMFAETRRGIIVHSGMDFHTTQARAM